MNRLVLGVFVCAMLAIFSIGVTGAQEVTPEATVEATPPVPPIADLTKKSLKSVGTPEFITKVTVKLPSGVSFDINVFGDIKLLTRTGFQLFQFTNDSADDIQKIADAYLLDTPSTIKALSINQVIQKKSKGHLQDGNTIAGASSFDVDLTKGVNVILTVNSIDEATAMLACTTANVSMMGVFVAPNTGDQLTMYVNLGCISDYIHSKFLPGLFGRSVIEPLGYVRFFQQAYKDGITSTVELGGALYALRRIAVDPAYDLGKDVFNDDFIKVIDHLLTTEIRIK